MVKISCNDNTIRGSIMIGAFVAARWDLLELSKHTRAPFRCIRTLEVELVESKNGPQDNEKYITS